MRAQRLGCLGVESEQLLAVLRQHSLKLALAQPRAVRIGHHQHQQREVLGIVEMLQQVLPLAGGGCAIAAADRIAIGPGRQHSARPSRSGAGRLHDLGDLVTDQRMDVVPFVCR